jgi:copper chaperone CopZ
VRRAEVSLRTKTARVEIDGPDVPDALLREAVDSQDTRLRARRWLRRMARRLFRCEPT